MPSRLYRSQIGSEILTWHPPATITWEFNQSTLPLQTDRFMHNTDLLFTATCSSSFSCLTLILLSRLSRLTVLLNGVLQIHNVRLEDAGKYRCVATNIGSRLKSREATLTVPRIIAGPQNVTVSLHHTVVLECVATGNPSPIISWSRADSKPIDVYNAKVLGNGNLVITDVNAKHSGVYLCRATTPGTRNHTTAAANLTVLGIIISLVDEAHCYVQHSKNTPRSTFFFQKSYSMQYHRNEFSHFAHSQSCIQIFGF
uniref:Protogenin homolog b (Gallus gallus) n=1 Tax=Poecilia reticulata TaxID=8081 RepID=A0A3P9PJR7_POERE